VLKLSRWLLLTAFLGCGLRLEPAGILMATTSRTQKTSRTSAAPTRTNLSSEGERWVAQTLKEMTLDEKIGQMFAVWCYGGFLSAESLEYKELLRDVEEKHIGSFALQTQGSPLGIERSQVYPTAVLVNTLQSHAKVPLLMAADFERGTSMRIDEGASFPHPMAVAATGRTEDAYTIGKITALEAKAAGIPWIFAPDADVNSNPGNPIINTRSFGEDPARVSEFVAAFVRGVEGQSARFFARRQRPCCRDLVSVDIDYCDFAFVFDVDVNAARFAIGDSKFRFPGQRNCGQNFSRARFKDRRGISAAIESVNVLALRLIKNRIRIFTGLDFRDCSQRF